MPPSLREIVSTLPGAIIVVLMLAAAASVFVWFLLRGAEGEEACDCPRKIVRRQDPADGWAVITTHTINCLRKDVP
jgi:hypothetical protein